MIFIAADEHALQRMGVLGSMGVSCDIRKEVLHIAVAHKTRYCREAQAGEGREVEVSKCERTILRRGGDIQVCKGR
jgi:hypothetical protein